MYRVSLIIPIYNMEKTLRRTLESVVKQSIAKEDLEVLMINDGSTDESAIIMEEFASKYKNMKAFHKENEGLSPTRNFGIKRATGKYIMYLDADDTLSKNSIKTLADFFDKHYEEVDLVTYDEIPVVNGEERKMHYRFDYLVHEGIYDLTLLENAYITQTNINVCVKNLREDNIFFDEDTSFKQEDQKYCTEIIKRKMKIGYVKGPKYFYIRQPDSITNSVFYAYYIFESTMKFWEDLFASYGNDSVPYYIQALYVNDINWKTNSDILLPYHYSEKELENSKNRIVSVLNKVDDELILNHPALGVYQKHFLISKKKNNEIRIDFREDNVYVFNHGIDIIPDNFFRIMVNRFKVNGNNLEFMGILESPSLIYLDEPGLKLYKFTPNQTVIDVNLRLSSYSYNKARQISCKKYMFQITIDIDELRKFKFNIVTGGKEYECIYRFNNYAPFGKKIKKIKRGRKEFELKGNCFHIKELTHREKIRMVLKQRKRFIRKDPKTWLMRNSVFSKTNERIWLYYDCKGVFKDNAYYQLEHDIEKNDGIKRYYVLNEDSFIDEKKKYPPEIRNIMVKFGSRKHKTIFLRAEKVITAYVERGNYNPFSPTEYKKFTDIVDFPQLYYLQHGVLHAHLPWKYSADRLLVTKEVISTKYEEKNLIENYCFEDYQLAKTCMARYDMIDSRSNHGNRILYAPSWRKYLIKQNRQGWVPIGKSFLNSKFFADTQKFLNSKELSELLEENNLYLDFKLHPIFELYKDCYTIDNQRVKIADKKVNETDYSIFITDFSSFVFDFAYLQTPVIYYVPDYEMFKAGMNMYRELDMPLEDGLGPLAKTNDELLEEIRYIINAGFDMKNPYKDRMDNLFFFKDNEQRKRIYEIIFGE